MVKRGSHISMYEQVAKTLRDEIAENKFKETSGYIGTLKELAHRFSVSLITVRKAVEILTKENLVFSKQGKGTFVKSFTVSDKLNKLTGITNIMEEANLHPEVTVRMMMEINTPEYFEDHIKKDLGEKCFFIERVHTVNNVISGYAKLYLPLKYGSKLTKEDIEDNTIYALYQNKFNKELGKGVQNIKAAKANKSHVDAMKIDTGTPMLFIERFSYDASGELIEVMELFYEYTQYYFRIESTLSAE